VIRTFYRVLFVLFIIAGALRSSAQSSDVAVWIVDSEMAESTVIDDGDTAVFDFEERAGYGLSFNHFWTSAFSTEVALQKYGADMTITPSGLDTFKVGELDVTSLTVMGQWHFNRDGRFSPYVGGGAARIGGEFDLDDDLAEPGEDTHVDLESELTWTAAVGANIRLTDHLALAGEIKVIPWNAKEENGLLEDSVDVDPVTFAAGVRWRF
jgi:outer membrane protein W